MLVKAPGDVLQCSGSPYPVSTPPGCCLINDSRSGSYELNSHMGLKRWSNKALRRADEPRAERYLRVYLLCRLAGHPARPPAGSSLCGWRWKRVLTTQGTVGLGALSREPLGVTVMPGLQGEGGRVQVGSSPWVWPTAGSPRSDHNQLFHCSSYPGSSLPLLLS